MRSVFTFVWSWLTQVYTFILVKLGFGTPVPGPEDPGIDDPGVDVPEPDVSFPGEIICYYGCPNSKRAQKLQLEKKLYR